MGISNQTKPTGTLKILWEGLKLPLNNCTLLRPVVAASFLSSSLLFIFSYLCVLHLVLDLAAESILVPEVDPESPELPLLLTAILKDLKELGIVELVFHVVSFVVNSLLAVAAVHVLSAAYAGKTASKIRELFSRLDQPLIKRAMITQVFAAFLQLGCTLIASLATGVLSVSYASSRSSSRSYVESTAIIVSAAIAAALAFYWCLYLFVVAQTSVVVSVAEAGCYGLEAIAKACKLIGGGRRQAVLIAFVELTVVVVYGLRHRDSPYSSDQAGTAGGWGRPGRYRSGHRRARVVGAHGVLLRTQQDSRGGDCDRGWVQV